MLSIRLGQNKLIISAIILPVVIWCILLYFNLASHFLNYTLSTPQVLIILLASPLIEEIVFRDVFQSVILRQVRLVINIVITNILFTILHFNNFSLYSMLFLLGVFVSGVLLSIIRWRYNNILICILLHAYYNTFVVLISYYYT